MAWLKLDDQIFLNRKVAQCDTSAKMLYIVGLSYCANQLTDGFIPEATLPLLAGMAGLDWQIAKQSAGKLLDVCLWSATQNGWQIPDYLEYNPSREQVLHNQVVRSEAGKRGGVAKSKQNAKQNPGKSLPPSPSPSPSSKYVTSSNGHSAEDALIDPELAQALAKWKETFTGTPYEANPPIAQLPKWLAYAGAEVMCYMIGKAKDKDNPGGYLFTTFDNWRKDGEVAPYVVKAAQDAKIAEQPIVMKTVKVDYGDGTFGEVEVQTRGT